MDCLDYFALMPVLAEDSLHSDTVFKGYIFTVFMYFLQWYFRSNTASGKTRQQCEKANASCIREGSIKMACHTPKPDLPSTKVHSEMPLAYDMAGNLPIYHLTASVAYTLQSSMH